MFTAREELNIQIQLRLISEFKYLMPLKFNVIRTEDGSIYKNYKTNYGKISCKEYSCKIGIRRNDVYNTISVVILW